MYISTGFSAHRVEILTASLKAGIQTYGRLLHGDCMTNAYVSTDNFLRRLLHICESENSDCFSLGVDDSETWPRFKIFGGDRNCPALQGYFVEQGSSFWQVSESGREVFTKDQSSLELFYEDIKEVIHTLATKGFVEERWRNSSGKVVRSLARITVPDGAVIFGKPPSVWMRDLHRERVVFAPLCPK